MRGRALFIAVLNKRVSAASRVSKSAAAPWGARFRRSRSDSVFTDRSFRWASSSEALRHAASIERRNFLGLHPRAPSAPQTKTRLWGTPGLFSFGPSGASASISEGIKACFPPCAQKMRAGWAPRFVQADALFLTLRFQFSRLSISMVKSPSLMR